MQYLYYKERYLNLKELKNRQAREKIRFSTHKLACRTAKWYILSGKNKSTNQRQGENEVQFLSVCSKYEDARETSS